MQAQGFFESFFKAFCRVFINQSEFGFECIKEQLWLLDRWADRRHFGGPF